MKTIWIFNHYAIPPELGPLTRHYKFGSKLVERGYNIRIFGSSTLHYLKKNMITDHRKFIEKEYDNVPFVFIKTMDYQGNGKKRILNMIQFAKGMLSVPRKLGGPKPDVIYASSAHPLTWISGYILSRRYKARFIAETRDLWPESLVKMGEIERSSIPARVLYKIEKFIYSKADKLVFTLPGGIDYVKNLGIEESKVHYINNGVDLEEFNLMKKEYINHLSLLNNNESFKVVYTGSIGKPNAVHTLIHAGEILGTWGYDNIEILIFGDGIERQQLEKYVKVKNLNNVRFYGRVEKKEIPSIITKSDLNIITGLKTDLYQYGLSLNKMFDYFAAEKPILSNIECEYDLLKKYECGITVEGEDPEALANGILGFYKMNSNEYLKFCENAGIAAKDFDFESLTDKLESLL